MAARYLRNFGLEAQGMTGAFHRSWGDFGTVRNQAALDFECFAMLAQANKCAIGDHLHPDGRLNPRTYERIGRTYRSVAEKEPWCEGATAVAEIAFFNPPAGAEHGSLSAVGVTRMLMQLHQQFDVLDSQSSLSRYKVAILADDYRLDAAMIGKLTAFLASGGCLILSHAAGLDARGKAFALPVGADYEGPWAHESQYIEALPPLRDGIPEMVHEMYETGSAIRTQTGATELARVWGGYFDKDFRHFQVEQTPFQKPTGHAGRRPEGTDHLFRCSHFPGLRAPRLRDLPPDGSQRDPASAARSAGQSGGPYFRAGDRHRAARQVDSPPVALHSGTPHAGPRHCGGRDSLVQRKSGHAPPEPSREGVSRTATQGVEMRIQWGVRTRIGARS